MKQFYALLILFFLAISAQGQFLTDSMNTYRVCDASGTQIKVKTFSDNQNGYHVFWLDKRNGNGGTSITMQRLDSSGVPLGTINGDIIANTVGKDIFGYDVSPWQAGYLITWVQGSFGIGGDSVFCDYISATGAHMWAQPTTVAHKTSSIIYVNEYGMRAMPNDSGATISYGVAFTGGSDSFSFNRIDFNGNLHWPVNNFAIATTGYINVVESDKHNGFFIASCSGGLGAAIYVDHFRLDGTKYNSAGLNISQNAGGRNGGWILLCDADTNAYVVWDNYSNDIKMTKINSDGLFAWPSEYVTVCGFAQVQTNVSAILDGNMIYVTWADSRIPANNYFIFTQAFDLNGSSQWTTDGIGVSYLTSYVPYPKVISRGDGSIANAYTVAGKFRMQSINADSTFDWEQNGLPVAIIAPFYGDFVLATDATGSVASFWSDGNDIFGARVSRNGLLTKINSVSKNLYNIYPNPAKEILNIRTEANTGAVLVSIYNIQGKLISTNQFPNHQSNEVLSISLNNLSSGLYFVKLVSDSKQEVQRFVVE